MHYIRYSLFKVITTSNSDFQKTKPFLTKTKHRHLLSSPFNLLSMPRPFQSITRITMITRAIKRFLTALESQLQRGRQRKPRHLPRLHHSNQHQNNIGFKTETKHISQSSATIVSEASLLHCRFKWCSIINQQHIMHSMGLLMHWPVNCNIGVQNIANNLHP